MNDATSFQETPVSWVVDEDEVQATLTGPVGEGPFPAVIFVAGSGPTDRDWNTPLIPGTNGSAAALARALAENGFVTLRYDKRGSGPHALEYAKRNIGKISFQSHVDELEGGVKFLASRPDVDSRRLFVFTNSEGCVHAINYQTQKPGIPFAGMILTSAFARKAGDLAHDQIAAQLNPLPGGAEMLAAYDAAIADFLANRPVQIDDKLPEAFRNVILGISQPANQPFVGELWVFDPTERLAEITVPVLVILGKKDIQVDWQTDGPIMEAVAKEHPNITLVYVENANHVLKFEARPRSQITAADAMQTYSAESVVLDREAVETIVSWLKAQTLISSL